MTLPAQPDLAVALDAALAALGVQTERERLARYGALVLETNREMNLTAARTPEAFAEHIADALTLAPLVRGPLVDIGTGGGLPGIPLAIVTGQPVTLIDATAKKVTALRRFLETLGLPGAGIAGRAETLGHDPQLRDHFETATCRAVGAPTTVAELTLPFVAVGGFALLQRGATSLAERDALADAALVLGAQLVDEREVAGERRIFILEKTVPTQHRFPRRSGVPAKRPLCVG